MEIIMTPTQMNMVTDSTQAIRNIERLNAEVVEYPELANRLGQAHAFYAIYNSGADTIFGFSKYCGYAEISAATYLKHYQQMDGGNTEHALGKWFDELQPDSSGYDEYWNKLNSWLGGFGKKPRKNVRIMILKPEYMPLDAADAPEDTRLLDLLIAVADLLPPHQRNGLRAQL